MIFSKYIHLCNHSTIYFRTFSFSSPSLHNSRLNKLPIWARGVLGKQWHKHYDTCVFSIPKVILFAASVHIGTSVVHPQRQSELCPPIVAQDLGIMDHLQMKARASVIITLDIARHILEGNRKIEEPFDQALSYIPLSFL